MDSLHYNDSSVELFPAHHFALSRHFFSAWQVRNALRKDSWIVESSPGQDEVKQANTPCSSQSHTQFISLQKKLQQLKGEIIGLMAQDTDLFQQLFALQEDIVNFREQVTYCSSGTSSELPSPYSTLSSPRDTSGAKITISSESFVRHRVSYPPIARNRSQAVQTPTPSHECQDSYDSGIHTSDLEIFV